MILVIRFWWEWAEYISIGLTLVGLMISFSANSHSFFFLAVTLSLMLHSFNRWRLEKRTKARMAATLNLQLRQFSTEVEAIKYKLAVYIERQKKEVLPPKIIGNMAPSDDKVIASLQEDVESLHQSLLTVIDYLKEEKIESRIKNLEILYQSLQSYPKNIPDLLPEVQLPDQNILNKSADFDLQPLSKIAWKCLHIINAHDEAVTDLAITNDRKYLVSISGDNYLKLWSLAEGQEINRIIASDQGLTKLAMSQDDYADGGMVTGSLDQDVKIWSLDNKSLSFSLKHSLPEHTGSIHGLAIASAKKIIVSGSFDRSLKQWDLSSGHLLYSSLNDNGPINAIAIHEGIGLIVTGGEDGMITMWELDSERKLGLLTGNVSSLESLAISNSGKLIAGGCADGSIKIWQLPTTTFSVFLEVIPNLELSGHDGQVMDLLFTSNNQLLYSAGVDGLIKIWHLPTAEEIGHLKISDDDRILSLAFSDDDRILAAGGVNGTIKIWQQNS